MPKTPSNKLFRLVKSLSGSEKRYFKIFINNKGNKENKYLRLFDAIEAQEVFDDEVLQDIVYPDEQVESRKYSELKAYLYDNILKSLQAYDEKSSVDYRIKGMLLSVRTLYKRSLFDDCKELLNKLKKVAVRYEDFNAQTEILYWEKQIAYAETDITYLDKELDRIETEQRSLLQQMQRLSEYRNVFFELLILLRKDTASSEEKIKDLNLHDSLFNRAEIEDTPSYKEKVLYYRALSLYHLSLKDFKSFYEVSKKLIQTFESKKYMLDEDVSEYISALSNHYIASGSLRKLDEVEEVLAKLKGVQPKTFDDKLKVYRQYYLGIFRLYISLGKFQTGYRVLTEHLKTRKKFAAHFFKKDTFYIRYFTLCFGAEKYSQAVDFLNEWIGMGKNVERVDLQSLARVLNLIVHYEIGNTEILDSFLRSTQRFLSDRGYYSDFEKSFLSALRRALELPSEKAKKEHWSSFSEELKELKNHSKIPKIFEWFSLDEWIEAKAKNLSYAEVVRNKAEAN